MTGTMIERVEVITGFRRRRRWSAEEKLRIVGESYRPGASVSSVARRHELNANQLFTWRRLAREGSLGGGGGGGEAGSDLVPVRVMSEAPGGATALPGTAEVCFPNGCRLSVAAGIEGSALRRLASALLAAG
jgi:transposase-like protein